jgi:hypothetical protein
VERVEQKKIQNLETLRKKIEAQSIEKKQQSGVN